MIYESQAIDVLCDYLKNQFDPNIIFREIMDQDENSTPFSYILLRAELNDTPAIFGDGITNSRVADCDIILVTKGRVVNQDSIHVKNKEKIKDCLKQNKVAYSIVDLGYDINEKNTQTTFSTRINYYG